MAFAISLVRQNGDFGEKGLHSRMTVGAKWLLAIMLNECLCMNVFLLGMTVMVFA